MLAVDMVEHLLSLAQRDTMAIVLTALVSALVILISSVIVSPVRYKYADVKI